MIKPLVVGYMLLLVSLLLHMAALAAFAAVVQALAVSSTLTAIESAFGTLVLALLLLLFARRCWWAAKSRMQSTD